MKNQNTTLWIIGIGILLLVVLSQTDLLEAQDDFSIKVHYYDVNGDEIFPQADTIGEDELSFGEEVTIKESGFFRNLISQVGLFAIVSTNVNQAYQDWGDIRYRFGDGRWYHSNSQPTLGIGTNTMAGGGKNRAWITFDVSGVPNNAIITGLNFWVYVTQAGTGGSGSNCPSNTPKINIYKVDEETINQYPTSSDIEEQAFFDQLDNGIKYGEISHLMVQDTTQAGIGWKYLVLGNSANSEVQSLIDGNPTGLFMVGLKGDIESDGANCYMWISESTLRIDYDYEECITHSTYSCYSNDVYWYDSCGVRGAKRTECGSDAYTGSNYCYLNDVYRDRIDNGCSGSSCFSNIVKVKQAECGTLGCSGGVCNTCAPLTCADVGSSCGIPGDGCGGTLSCGTCGTGLTCSADTQCAPEVAFISFEITVTNVGNVNFNEVRIIDMQIVETADNYQGSIDLNDRRTIEKNTNSKWYSNQIPTKNEWVGATTRFKVWVAGTNSYTGLEEIKTAYVDLAL